MAKEFDKSSRLRNADADCFCEGLGDRGYNFATGIPCGLLRHFISNFSHSGRFLHVVPQSEPEAVGIATGAYLGGRKPIVYMQNSGFLKSINEIGSLVLPHKIKMPFLISHRGVAGEDAPQHLINGQITKPVLDLLGISYYNMGKDGESVEDILDKLDSDNVAILIQRGWSDNYIKGKFETDSTLPKFKPQGYVNNLSTGRVSLNREDAIDSILSLTSGIDAIFSTTGLIGRSVYERHDAPNHFYNTGGFGLTSSEGLGFALAKPDVRTIVIDGDAGILTNLGSLVTIGKYEPKNLLHIVLDNEAFASCSEEKSSSVWNNLANNASICGYNSVFVVDDSSGLQKAVEKSGDGCTFIQAKINLGGRRNFKRPLDLEYITNRFREYFK